LDLLSKLSGRGKDESLGLLLSGVDLDMSMPLGKNKKREETHSLKDRDRESSGLSSTRLGLSDTITASNDGHNGSLLDSRGSLETVGVDTSEKVTLQLHVVKAEWSIKVSLPLMDDENLLVGNLVPVGLDEVLADLETIFVVAG
jgi:hypothetical protein